MNLSKLLPVCLLFPINAAICQSLVKSFDHNGVDILSVSFDKTGERIITGGADKRVNIWETNTGNKIKTFAGHSEGVTSVAVNQDNTIMASVSNSSIITWDVTAYKPIKILKGHSGSITQLAFGSNGNYLVSSSNDSTARIWDVDGAKMLYTLSGHKNSVNAVFIQENNVFSAGADQTIRQWNLATGQFISSVTVGFEVSAIEPAPNGLIATGGKSGLVYLYDQKTLKKVKELSTKFNAVNGLSFAGNGKFLAIAGPSGKFELWDVSLNKLVSQTDAHVGKINALKISPDEKLLATAGNDGFLKVWDISLLHISKAISSNTPNKTNKKTSIPPVITLIQPVTEWDKEYYHTEKQITIKGNVKASDDILLFLVNGSETSLGPTGDFTAIVPIAYLKTNEIPLKAIDKSNNITEKTLKVIRPMDKNDPNAVANLNKRNGVDYALLIGTNDYQEMGKLSNPVFDMATIAEELQNNYSFKVKTVADPTLDGIYSVLREYGKMQFAEEDQLVIFIAGHGEYDDVFNEGYLVAKDSKKADEIKKTYISHSNLRTIINNIKCKHILLVLDVCFGGTFDATASGRGGDEYASIEKDEFIKRKLKYKTRQYITSGGKTYVPDGRPGQHSPFARRFLESLRSLGGSDKILTLKEIHGFIEKVQPEPRHGEFGDNEPGSDFVFIAR